MSAITCVDQLHCDLELVPRFSDTALDDIHGAERSSNLAQVTVVTPELERGCPPDHLETRDLGEQIQDLFGDSVTKILLIMRFAHINERQHGDRLVGWYDR